MFLVIFFYCFCLCAEHDSVFTVVTFGKDGAQASVKDYGADGKPILKNDSGIEVVGEGTAGVRAMESGTHGGNGGDVDMVVLDDPADVI